MGLIRWVCKYSWWLLGRSSTCCVLLKIDFELEIQHSVPKSLGEMWNTFPSLSQTFTGSHNFAVALFFWTMSRNTFWHRRACGVTLRHFRWLSRLQMPQFVADFRVTDFVSVHFFFREAQRETCYFCVFFSAVSIIWEVGRNARAIWVHWQSLIGIRPLSKATKSEMNYNSTALFIISLFITFLCYLIISRVLSDKNSPNVLWVVEFH